MLIKTITRHKKIAAISAVAIILVLGVACFILLQGDGNNKATAKVEIPTTFSQASYTDEMDNSGVFEGIVDSQLDAKANTNPDSVSSENLSNSDSNVVDTSQNENNPNPDGSSPDTSNTPETKPVAPNSDNSNSEFCYVFDVNDPRALVGHADYVFIGRVKDVIGVEYKYDDHHYASPYTNYSIEVLDNIKGELIKGTINLQKYGDGIHQSSITSGDFMPQIEEICIFLARTREDGSLLLFGMNSNIAIKLSGQNNGNIDSLLSEIKATSEYITFKDASANQITSQFSDGITKPCKYDVNAN